MRHYSPLLAVILLLLPATAQPWVLLGYRWSNANTTLHVDLEEPWRSDFEASMREWNSNAPFTFLYAEDTFQAPCDSSRQYNSVIFSETVCADEWGVGVIGLTTFTYYSHPPIRVDTGVNLGVNALVQSDIFFNSNRSWGLYPGPLRDGEIDFRRVALHELGHALGLGHENNEQSVMKASNVEVNELQPDDIAAAAALYFPGYRTCQVEATSPRLGAALSAEIAAEDCPLLEFFSNGATNGAGYASVIESKGDIYDLSELSQSLESSQPVSIHVHSDRVRMYTPLLGAIGNTPVVASQGEFVRMGCGTLYTYNFLPSQHLLWAGRSARTGEGAESCPGTQEYGDYTISVFQRRLPFLPELTRLPAGNAYFSGGASIDGGENFAADFLPSEAIDVTASILPAPPHVGERASLYVVALLTTGHTFAKTPNGWQLVGNPATFWDRWDASPFTTLGGLPALQQTESLKGEEWIEVVNGLKGEDLNISSIVFRVHVGYALDSAPDTIYHHAEPIEFFIR